MQVDIKLSFDLDDEEQKEKYEKINAVLTEVEEEEEEEKDYKGALESFKEKFQERLGNAKSGSPTEKALTKVEEDFDDVMSEYDIELD